MTDLPLRLPANWRLPAGFKLSGVNDEGPYFGAAPEDRARLYAEWPEHFEQHFKPNIARARALGANALRLWNVSPQGVKLGLYSEEHLIGCVRQLALELAKNDMWFYPCGHYGYRGIAPLTVSELVTWMQMFAPAMAAEPNVMALDLINEGQYLPESAELVPALVHAVRRAAPDLPITVSAQRTEGNFDNNSTLDMWNDDANFQYLALFDFLDMHPYYTGTPDDARPTYTRTDKPLIVGEYGAPRAVTDRFRRYQTAATMLDHPNCLGIIAWEMIGISSDPAVDFGMFDQRGHDHGDVTPFFRAGTPVQQSDFGGWRHR